MKQLKLSLPARRFSRPNELGFVSKRIRAARRESMLQEEIFIEVFIFSWKLCESRHKIVGKQKRRNSMNENGRKSSVNWTDGGGTGS